MKVNENAKNPNKNELMSRRVLVQGAIRDDVLNVMSLLIHPLQMQKRLSECGRILMITDDYFVSSMSAEKLRENFDHLVVNFTDEENFKRLRWIDLPLFWVLDFDQNIRFLKNIPSGSGYGWVNRHRGSVTLWISGNEEEYWPSNNIENLDVFLRAVILCRLVGFSKDKIQNDVARLDIVNF